MNDLDKFISVSVALQHLKISFKILSVTILDTGRFSTPEQTSPLNGKLLCSLQYLFTDSISKILDESTVSSDFFINKFKFEIL